MDLISTKQTDYKPFVYSEAAPEPIAEQRRKGAKFAGKSVYEMAYPNWGPYEIVHMKHFNVPHNMDKIKLNTKTTYTSAFRPGDTASNSRIASSQVGKHHNPKSSLLSSSAEFYDETTTKRYFLDPRLSNIRTESMKTKEQPLITEVPANHFKSHYQCDFERTEARQLQIKPRKLAELIES